MTPIFTLNIRARHFGNFCIGQANASWEYRQAASRDPIVNGRSSHPSVFRRIIQALLLALVGALLGAILAGTLVLGIVA
jgi:ABC-type phosphate/phosphonate transport system permease subunit